MCPVQSSPQNDNLIKFALRTRLVKFYIFLFVIVRKYYKTDKLFVGFSLFWFNDRNKNRDQPIPSKTPFDLNFLPNYCNYFTSPNDTKRLFGSFLFYVVLELRDLLVLHFMFWLTLGEGETIRESLFWGKISSVVVLSLQNKVDMTQNFAFSIN